MSGSDWLRLLALSLLWGGSFFFVQVAVPVLPALTIVVIRVGLAAVVLALVLPVLRVRFPSGVRVWAALAVMGLMNNVIPFTLFVMAQGQITSGLASILNATTHVATRDERLTLAKGVGVLVGFAGVAVMMGGAFGEGTIWAQAAGLGAALSYALAGVWGRRFRTYGLAPLSTALGQVAMATVMLVPIVALVDQPWTLALPDWPVIAALIGLATLSTALAYALYFGLIASAGAVNAFLVTFLVPVSAIGLGVLILGEALLPRQVAGMALIALGLAAIDGRAGRWVWQRVRQA